MLLEAKNVTKRFGEVLVLDNVSLSVEAGDFVSIIGKSGSGKSTLLTILGGIDRPTSGEVLLDGIDISKQKERELAKLRRTKLGFVFQFFNLAPYLTARENILLPTLLNGKTEKSQESSLNELSEYLGITPLLNKLPSKMSGGEQQRVAIARGLIFEPELILLDEPTGNLDTKNSDEIMKLLKKVNVERGTTVIQVTHSAQNAEFGNRIVRISDGKIVDIEMCGDPNDRSGNGCRTKAARKNQSKEYDETKKEAQTERHGEAVRKAQTEGSGEAGQEAQAEGRGETP